MRRLWLPVVTGFCGLGIPPRRPLWGRENAAQIFSGSYGRVPTQTQESDDEHLSEIVSYFLSIGYFSSSEVFSVWISSSHFRRTVPGVRATGVQVDGAPPSRASLLLFSVGLREDEHCVRWKHRAFSQSHQLGWLRGFSAEALHEETLPLLSWHCVKQEFELASPESLNRKRLLVLIPQKIISSSPHCVVLTRSRPTIFPD